MVPKILNPQDNLNHDAYININTELKPALIEQSKSFFSPSHTSTSESSKCTNLEGCPIYSQSFLALEPNLNTISKVPPSINIFIQQGQNDSQAPVQQAFLLQQKLTQINYPATHILITYPNLGHDFYPSSQWITTQGPIQQNVLADLYYWLETHSASNTTASAGHRISPSISNSTTRFP